MNRPAPVPEDLAIGQPNRDAVVIHRMVEGARCVDVPGGGVVVEGATVEMPRDDAVLQRDQLLDLHTGNLLG